MDEPKGGRAPHVVIVGGGFGGLYAARSLADAPVRVTLVDRHNYHLFQPLLYQVATAALSPRDIAQPIRSILRRQKNTEVVLAEVVSVDLRRRRLLLEDGELSYDRLILAAGARHSYFGHNEWQPSAPGLKTLDDALGIRRRLLLAFEAAEREAAGLKGAGPLPPEAAQEKMGQIAALAGTPAGPEPGARAYSSAELHALLTFIVVGGGPTGVELAGAIAEIARHSLLQDFRWIDPSQARVVLLEAGPRILPSFPESLSLRAARQLERLGVEVKTCSKLEEILVGRGVRIENGPASGSPGKEWIAARTVLWAAGVLASPLARPLGVPLDRAGRVLVEADLSLPGHPEVQVIGDLAAFVHQTGKPLPGLAPVAIQQGRHAALNIARSLGGEPMLPFRYRDKGNLATIGRSKAVADIFRLRLSGLIAWLAWAWVHIYFLIGFRNRFLVMFEWAWVWITYQRGARLITGEPGFTNSDSGEPAPSVAGSGSAADPAAGREPDGPVTDRLVRAGPDPTSSSPPDP